MAETEYDEKLYNKLIEKYKDYIDTIDKLYNIKPEFIEDLYTNINALIKKYKMLPCFFINTIALFIQEDPSAIKSYWTIIELLMKEHIPEIGFIALEYPDNLKTLLKKNYKKNLTCAKKIKIQGKQEKILAPFPERSIEFHLLNDDVDFLKEKSKKVDESTLSKCCQFGAITCYNYLKSIGCKPSSNNVSAAIAGKNKEIIMDVLNNIETKDGLWLQYQ
ncbi:hypothetical protein TVAG_427480 [Trichomonas vaginalis G3]|uniref:DUF3447 domain-containing protein n=1 Tax=Trichomonas vaginalis (strain ATCC PRA-98 / G3) TaxID=412133 RepID=A2F667_TRIV3|nr:spectrin binding [Trichomonas vaginalis G3]EAX99584.1 hypothetical protein TVAG_427480 [Trichomonas vaginalis G3]KAI5506465.1 spectrin binding [Trichomonas vaginalis G3]|eukprot:XP_001312514.1 hypothetical protein [Trichomonas vaginalis G3]